MNSEFNRLNALIELSTRRLAQMQSAGKGLCKEAFYRNKAAMHFQIVVQRRVSGECLLSEMGITSFYLLLAASEQEETS